MGDNLHQYFGAFELFGEESLIRGFLRVARLALIRADHVQDTPAYGFSQPFDARFGKMMVKTGSHLLGALGEILFGVASCREISVLLAGAEAEDSDGDGRQLLSQLGGEASGKMTLLLGEVIAFESCLYEFPSPELVREYFLWRQQHNEAYVLDRYFRYALLKGGTEPERIPELIEGYDPEEKLEVLVKNDIDYAKVPPWQRRGVGLYWQAGVDDQEPTLVVDTQLPEGNSYETYLKRFL
jgi:tRNA(His) 5'-end guanylyltransferase